MFPMFALGGLAFWGSVLYLGFRFVRSAEQRGVRREEIEDLRSRVLQLEEDLASAHGEIERIAAGEKFTAQLLAGRPGNAPPST